MVSDGTQVKVGGEVYGAFPFFCVPEDEKAREGVECGSVGKVADSTFCKSFVDHATGKIARYVSVDFLYLADLALSCIFDCEVGEL